MSTLHSIRLLCRTLCDHKGFRIGVAVVAGLPLLAMGAVALFVGFGASAGLWFRIGSPAASGEDLTGLIVMAGVFLVIGSGIVGITLRVVFSWAALAGRPALRRMILVLTIPAMILVLLVVAFTGLVPPLILAVLLAIVVLGTTD